MKKLALRLGLKRVAKGILLVEILIASAIFALMFQGSMLLLESAMLMNTIAKREQTSGFCIAALNEYFQQMGYGSLAITANSTFNTWRLFSASDTFGVKDFIQQVEAPSSPATCTGATASTQYDMQWRLVQTQLTIMPDIAGCTATFTCYPDGAVPNKCDVRQYFYRIDVRYRTPNMHGAQTYRVVSFNGSKTHDCRLGL